MQALRTYRLHCDGSKRPLVEVVPDGPLYRVRWPDGELSDIANLSRCCDAARRWAEQEIMTEHAAGGRQRSLKSLAKISWSSSLVAPNEKSTPRAGPFGNNAPVEGVAA